MGQSSIDEKLGVMIGQLDGIQRRLDRIDARGDSVDKRIDDVHSRINSVQGRLNWYSGFAAAIGALGGAIVNRIIGGPG